MFSGLALSDANVFLLQEPMSEMERGEVSERAVLFNLLSLLIDLSSQLVACLQTGIGFLHVAPMAINWAINRQCHAWWRQLH